MPSKEALGASAGIDVPTASVAIVQEGEAKKLIKEIVDKNKPAKKAEEAPETKASEPAQKEKPSDKPKEKPREKKE